MTRATIQHDKMNSFFSICSEILLYVDGSFEYVVGLYLYQLTYISSVIIATLNIWIMLWGPTTKKQE